MYLPSVTLTSHSRASPRRPQILRIKAIIVVLEVNLCNLGLYSSDLPVEFNPFGGMFRDLKQNNFGIVNRITCYE